MTWNPSNGHDFSSDMEDKIINDLLDTRIVRRGLSLSGGDPLHPNNVKSVLRLVVRVRNECQGKDIWLWTGYKIDELNDCQRKVVDLIDVLIDGKFEQDLYNPELLWRGSSNQKIRKFK